MTTNEYVRKAIMATKAFDSEYYWNCIKQRIRASGESRGSVVDFQASAEEFEETLLSANWEEVEDCPNLLEGCKAFKTHDINGYLGVIDINELDPKVKLVLDDYKKVGVLTPTVRGFVGNILHPTYLIVGNEGGQQMMFTFHPGPPIMPSTLKADAFHEGDKITVSEGLSLGLKFAKIV